MPEFVKTNKIVIESDVPDSKVWFNTEGVLLGFLYEKRRIQISEGLINGIKKIIKNISRFKEISNKILRGQFLKNREILYKDGLKRHLEGTETLLAFFDRQDVYDEMKLFIEEPNIGFFTSKYILAEQKRNPLFKALNLAVKFAQKDKKYQNREEKEVERAYYVLVLLWAIFNSFSTKDGKNMYSLIVQDLIKVEYLQKNIEDTISGHISNSDPIIIEGKISHDIDLLVKNLHDIKHKTNSVSTFFRNLYEGEHHNEGGNVKDIGKTLERSINNPNKLNILDTNKFCFNTINLIAGISVFWLEKEKRSNDRKNSEMKHINNKNEKIDLGNYF